MESALPMCYNERIKQKKERPMDKKQFFVLCILLLAAIALLTLVIRQNHQIAADLAIVSRHLSALQGGQAGALAP